MIGKNQMNLNSRSIVFWITGLSGAGKTTLGALLTEKLRDRGYAVIFLDGDILREIDGNRFGRDQQGRLEASLHYARLCKMLVEQNVHVVCATISLFHKTQQWNRKNIQNYIEILLDVPMDELIRRDCKKIYSRALTGQLQHVVGVDIQPELPEKPDIIINNEITIENSVNLILEHYEQKVWKN